MKEKIEDLLKRQLSISTKNFCFDYDNVEDLFEMSGMGEFDSLIFRNTEEMREVAQTLFQIAKGIDDVYKFSMRDEYFFVHPSGEVRSGTISGFAHEYFCMAMANIFRTREEAEEKKEEILAKFDKALEKYVRN